MQLDYRTHTLLTRLICLALLGHIALSWSLWYPGAIRAFPLLPVWGSAQPPESSIWQMLPSAALFLALGLAFLFPQKKYFVPGLAVVLLAMVALDMNRLQPWTYFYLLAIGLLAAQRSSEKQLTLGLQWLLAAVYAWGGLNKITPYFAEDNFPWFCEAFLWTKPMGAYPTIGYAVAAAEFLLAPGLLWLATRPLFRWLAIGFHLFLIVALSPLGLNWNTVVIPWNFAMAGMVWVVFSKGASQDGISTLFPEKRAWQAWTARTGILILAWFFPLLNIWHLWDEPLSWKMYSNTQTEAGVYLEDDAKYLCLQPIWKKCAFEKEHKLLFDDWALRDLHVPAYNSRRTHRQLAQYLCHCATNPARSGLWRLTVQRWNRSAERWESIPCTALIR